VTAAENGPFAVHIPLGIAVFEALVSEQTNFPTYIFKCLDQQSLEITENEAGKEIVWRFGATERFHVGIPIEDKN